MKNSFAMGFVCLSLGLGLASVGCAGEQAETISATAEAQVVTITAGDVAALAPGASLAVDLASTTVYRLDSTKGALDLSRIQITDPSGSTEAMDTWFSRVAPELASSLPSVLELGQEGLTAAPPTGGHSRSTEATYRCVYAGTYPVSDGHGGIVMVKYYYCTELQ